MLEQRCRRWPNNKPALAECMLFCVSGPFLTRRVMIIIMLDGEEEFWPVSQQRPCTIKAHLHIERETRNRANLRETRGEIPTTHKARNRAGYENQP